MANINMKSILAILVIVLVVQMNGSVAQENTCAAELGGLNQCAPFVVPGAANTMPNSDCCAALGAVTHDCLCNTLRVASRLPASCNLPVLNCSN
ncbi:protein MEN-8-like [Spinacia oleracea]|uniref:Protein MEN-8-like n=1 Tax=Spinacia oleracea TaxID=3562 RepID=A0A9R0I4I5_SPIOL|nr:protein MEN-8-like [Spinacia oleracea]